MIDYLWVFFKTFDLEMTSIKRFVLHKITEKYMNYRLVMTNEFISNDEQYKLV